MDHLQHLPVARLSPWPIGSANSLGTSQSHARAAGLRHNNPNIVEFEKRRARKRQGEGRLAGGHAKHGSALAPTGAQADAGRVSGKLAEKAGIGRRTVEHAIKVREEGIPEVNATPSRCSAWRTILRPSSGTPAAAQACRCRRQPEAAQVRRAFRALACLQRLGILSPSGSRIEDDPKTYRWRL